MISCPVCDSDIDVEEDDLSEGDIITCDECGADLRVVTVHPLDVEPVDEEDEDEEEEDEDLDYDEEEEDEEEEEEEDWK